jgi:hypothetical protein
MITCERSTALTNSTLADSENVDNRQSSLEAWRTASTRQRVENRGSTETTTVLTAFSAANSSTNVARPEANDRDDAVWSPRSVYD